MAAASEILAEHDTRLWRVVAHYVEQAQAKRDWSELKRVLIDETSSRKGHRYVTNFVDATTRELLFMVEGHGAESIAAFAQELTRHNTRAEQIELLSINMKPSFIAAALSFFPKAEVVFDHFHIMQMAGKALDEVLKELLRDGADLKGSLWSIRGNSCRSALLHLMAQVASAIGSLTGGPGCHEATSTTSITQHLSGTSSERRSPQRNL